jgi:hypothetical protein
MLERGGGGKAPWWSVAECLREAEERRREELVVVGSSWQSWRPELGANGMRGEQGGVQNLSKLGKKI